MVYDIIEKMAVIATSGANLQSKLQKAAGLFLVSFPFDQCLIYLKDGKGVTLRSRDGLKEGAVNAYTEGTGIAGLVKKAGRTIEMYKRNAAETSWNGIEDAGLMGFRSVIVFPLAEGVRFYGVLYLKGRKRVVLGPQKTRLMRIAAVQLTSILKFMEIVSDYKEAAAELEDASARLKNAEKMILLGDMTAALAHEIKNPLLSVGGFAARIRRKIEDDSPVIPYIDDMMREIKRLEKIINSAVDSLTRASPSEALDDLNEIVGDALGFFTDDFRRQGIKVIRDLCAGGLKVRADREEIKIVFDNLIANAIQSMAKGGTLNVSTQRNKDWVIVEFTDSGRGIDPRHIAHIFNPFFTTKKDGTGLGLAITSSIIMRHKGVIDVTNRSGEGVTVKVKLPCACKGDSYNA